MVFNHIFIVMMYLKPFECWRRKISFWLIFRNLTEPLYIHRLSCYLFGRERRVADVPTDHPSCSKQHAVIQYRSKLTILLSIVKFMLSSFLQASNSPCMIVVGLWRKRKRMALWRAKWSEENSSIFCFSDIKWFL